MQEVSPEDLGKTIIESIQEKKGQEIVHLNLSNTDNTVCEFFIIAHADSGLQVRAIARHVEENLKKKHAIRVTHAEGYENAQWILLDFDSIVVHIFQHNIREYYKLEELWADADTVWIKETGAFDL